MTDKQNNFKQLMEEESRMHPHPPPETELGVMGSTRVIRFMSDVVDLYLPRVFDMFVALFGGNQEVKSTVPVQLSDSPSSSDSDQSENGNPTT